MSALADPTQQEQEGTLDLRGGRRLSYALYGAAFGRTVVVLDGPGSRGLARAAADTAVHEGFRLIAPDRPGFFDSTPVPDRTIMDWAADHAALLDALGVERAGILAQSGGTPYALAAAAALPHRIAALAFTGPLAPLDEAGALAEAGGQFRSGVKIGRRAPWLLRFLMRRMAAQAHRSPEKAAMQVVPKAASADRAVLERRRWRDLHVQSTKEVLSRPEALAQEILLLGRPWGIDLGHINAPAAYWVGERDETHPPSHARRLAARLGGEVTVVPDAATFGLLPHYGDALRFAAR